MIDKGCEEVILIENSTRKQSNHDIKIHRSISISLCARQIQTNTNVAIKKDMMVLKIQYFLILLQLNIQSYNFASHSHLYTKLLQQFEHQN